jgi:hypothetical protein
MIRDIRFAVRTLMTAPGFNTATVLTLALGIGANTAIFSVVNQVLLNPGGMTNPERIVALRVKYDNLALRSIPVSVPDFADVKGSTDLFQNAAIQGTGAYNLHRFRRAGAAAGRHSISGMVRRLRCQTATWPHFPTRGRQA